MTANTVGNLSYFLRAARKYNASDVHLIAGLPPAFRVAGEIAVATNLEPLSRDRINELVRSVLTDMQMERIEEEREMCISIHDDEFGRVRIALYHRMNAREMAIRLCNLTIKSAAELMLPKVVDDFAQRAAGLFLVTGPTGSGKTTTLNYMVDLVNHSRRGKIVTIEDPIEFEHPHRKCVITQIEVGTDTASFSGCLRQALRWDPDVIVIGEMRDLETIATALTAAETGHLVLATLHTPSAVGTAERIVHSFPGHHQGQVAMQVAGTILGILSQRLLTTVDKKGRVLAVEMLVGNEAVRAMIREQNFHQLPNAIWSGRGIGMQSMEMSLVDLYYRGLITRASMYSAANSVSVLESLLRTHAGNNEP